MLQKKGLRPSSVSCTLLMLHIPVLTGIVFRTPNDPFGAGWQAGPDEVLSLDESDGFSYICPRLVSR